MKLFGKKKTVLVEFIDVETGKLLGKSEVPPENLPETFELDTTLHLGDMDWTVVSAEPEHSAEFLKTKELRLVLQKASMIDPAKILFSIPSICNFLGEVDEESETTGSELTIHEDDWRNIELVSLQYRDEIDSDLQEIYRIHKEQKAGHGFRALHVRKSIQQPLEPQSIPFTELDNFERAHVFTGLAYLNNKLVVDGFAFLTAGGISWYGRQKNGFVQELCLATCLPNDQTERDVEVLTKLMQKYELGFADWCRVFFANSEQADALKSYFFQTHEN